MCVICFCPPGPTFTESTSLGHGWVKTGSDYLNSKTDLYPPVTSSNSGEWRFSWGSPNSPGERDSGWRAYRPSVSEAKPWIPAVKLPWLFTHFLWCLALCPGRLQPHYLPALTSCFSNLRQELDSMSWLFPIFLRQNNDWSDWEAAWPLPPLPLALSRAGKFIGRMPKSLQCFVRKVFCCRFSWRTYGSKTLQHTPFRTCCAVKMSQIG